MKSNILKPASQAKFKLRRKLKTGLPVITLCLSLMAFAQDDPEYVAGQKAIRAQRWEQAIDAFELSSENNRATRDAATYWQAYALFKLGRDREARRKLNALERRFPNSKWLDDAQALKLDNDKQSIERGDDAEQPLLDEELRLFALGQLMENNPRRALPLLEKTLRNTNSKEVRHKALFILSMSENNQAQQLITDIAKNSHHSELQIQAIQLLGVSGTRYASGLIREILQNAQDHEVKRAVIQAAIASDDKGLLMEALRNESGPEIQHEVINALGVIEATDELRALYPNLKDQESKAIVLRSLAIAEDIEGLKQVIRIESNVELKREAIRSIGIVDNHGSVDLLKQIYIDSNEYEEKQAVLHALMMIDEGQELAYEIATTETNPELLNQAIQALGAMNAQDRLKLLYDKISDAGIRASILRSLGIANDAEGLIKILETETNSELRFMAIQSLGISGGRTSSSYLSKQYSNSPFEERHAIINALMISGESGIMIELLEQETETESRVHIIQTIGADFNTEAMRYLADLYADANGSEKQAILQSMMIASDADGLVKLLKQEQDVNNKRNILRTLTLIDSETATEYLFELMEQEQ